MRDDCGIMFRGKWHVVGGGVVYQSLKEIF